jgi:hypothetical protein
LTILHNLHINRIRRLVREQDNAIVASGCLALAQTEPSARLDLLDVERAIGKLPELQRRVILLIGLEGMRYDEAAQILAVPIGTIRSRIARARQTLRELLECDLDAAASFDRSIPRTRSALPVPIPRRHTKNLSCRGSRRRLEVKEDDRIQWRGPTHAWRELADVAHQ